MQLPIIIKIISKELKKQNAKAIVVGGAVRDHFLGLIYKDIDVEVYGLENIESLEVVLSEFGSVNLVGKSFGVLKFSYEKEEYDFSFPRKENKIAVGHRGFDVIVDGNMDFIDAARRRDFTLNALGYDIETETFLDPFGGLEDIKKRQLKYIDKETFIEDPLRVYRAVQFCARFGYSLTDDTIVLCKHMVDDGLLSELPKERVHGEFAKLLLKSPKPSLGFNLMLKIGILKRYFPELFVLVGVPQSPIWHPEGDVWVHTMMTLDKMSEQLTLATEAYDNKQRLKFLFAILCHDLGKATHTTIGEDGRIRSVGHEEAGMAPTKSLMYRLMDEHDFIESILPFVEHHLKPSQFYRSKAKATAIRKLATKVNIEELIVVARADFLGRTTEASIAGIYHAGNWLLEKSKNLKVNNKPLDNLLQGRDLLTLGFEPSPQFKHILEDVYSHQLIGSIKTKEDAIEFVKKKYCY